MKRRNKIILAIIVILILAIGAYAGFKITQISSEPDLLEGEQNVLILGIDESEQRQGLGAVDMAFMVHLENGTIKNYTPVFPHGMTHPTVQEPAEYQSAGAGQMLLLHDCFYWDDPQKDLQYAKEIVEHSNQSMKVDAVVGVTTAGIDAILEAASPIEVKNQTVTVKAIDLIRENDQLHGGGMSRGEAVKLIIRGLVKASKDPNKKSKMINAAMDQYSQGNIVVYPKGVFVKLIASKGVDALL